MNNKVAECIRNLASYFTDLAEELEKQQEANDKKMTYIEGEAMRNREALKEVANVILNRLS